MDQINRPCNEETESKIRAALATLHTVLAEAMGNTVPAKNAYELIARTAGNIVVGCDKYRRETALNSLRNGVLVIAKDAVTAKRAERAVFESEIAALPAKFQAACRKEQGDMDHVVIPLASFTSVFPTGTDTATMRAALQAIGMKLQGPTDNMGVRLSVV
jgi:thymidine phosphorylase